MMKAKFTLLLFFFLFKNLLSAQVIEQDSLALVAFYHATNGESWVDNTNWLSSEPVGQWYGIQVNEDRVTNLRLEYNNLTGELPPEIGNLTGLITMSPYGNLLSGMLPAEIGNLINLQYLELAQNKFTGSVPASIANCENLRSISLYGNAFSGPFPEALLSLQNLEQLELSYNNFSGHIPPQISGMTMLQQFGVENNSFSGAMPSLKALVNLGALYLATNELTGDVADFLGYYPNMWYLRLNQNAFTGCLSDSFFNSQSLRFLDLGDNQISCLGNFTEFAQGGALARITVQGNVIPFEYLETSVGVSNFTYTPQGPLLDSAMHLLEEGEGISISSGSGGIYTQYQWFHNGLPITGATSAELVISDFQITDQGTYHSEMTNEMLPGLTLVRNPVTLQMDGISKISHISPERLIINPNPVDDFFYLNTIDGAILIEVVDASGHVLLQVQAKGDQPVDVSHLAPGVYFVVAHTADKRYIGRFVKNAF